MRFVEFDYHPAVTDGTDAMERFWSLHWQGREDRRSDLRDEPLWATIEDVLDAPGSILEAGCGPGQWVQFFDGLGHRTVGLDYALSGLRAARRVNPTLRLLRGDLRTLPFADATFDYIYSNGAVEHDMRGPEAALREFRRVLKPTGWLMCSVPCLNLRKTLALPSMWARDWLKKRALLRKFAGKTHPFEFYQYVYAPSTYRSILESCAFEVMDLRPYGCPPPGPLERLLARVAPARARFFANHMMMAIGRPRQ